MVTDLQNQVLQIRAAAELLGLPQTAACTAITLLKRISTQELPVTQLCAQDYVAACLFLACKIEEVRVPCVHPSESTPLYMVISPMQQATDWVPTRRTHCTCTPLLLACIWDSDHCMYQSLVCGADPTSW